MRVAKAKALVAEYVYNGSISMQELVSSLDDIGYELESIKYMQVKLYDRYNSRHLEYRC